MYVVEIIIINVVKDFNDVLHVFSLPVRCVHIGITIMVLMSVPVLVKVV